jgi:very-short-patch-repair endonuclease
LVLEIDGAHHAEFRQRARDQRKDSDLFAKGLCVLKIPAQESCSAVLRKRIADVMWQRVDEVRSRNKRHDLGIAERWAT